MRMRVSVTNAVISLIILLELSGRIHSKIVEGKIHANRVDEKQCIFLTRFGTKSGGGSIKFDVSVTGMEGEWKPMTFSLVAADEKNQARMGRVGRVTEGNERENVFALISSRYNVLMTTKSRLDMQLSLPPSRLLHLYFCDLDGELQTGGDQAPNLRAVVFEYRLELLDRDQGHESLEQKSLDKLMGALLLLYCLALAWLGHKIRGYWRLNEGIDHPLLLIWLCIAFQAVGISAKLIDSYFLAQDGKGIALLEIGIRFWYMMADGLLSFLLVLLTKGWGVAHVDISAENEGEMILAAFLVMFRYVWLLAGFFLSYTNDDYYTHMYDGFAGYCELFNTLALAVWFGLSLKVSAELKKAKFAPFRQQLAVQGAVYFLVRPLVVLAVLCLSNVDQHFYSLLFTLLAHLGVAMMFGVSFTNKNGNYMKYSISNGLELVANKPTE